MVQPIKSSLQSRSCQRGGSSMDPQGDSVPIAAADPAPLTVPAVDTVSEPVLKSTADSSTANSTVETAPAADSATTESTSADAPTEPSEPTEPTETTEPTSAAVATEAPEASGSESSSDSGSESDDESDGDDVPDRGAFVEFDDDGDEDVGLSTKGGSVIRSTHELSELPPVSAPSFARLGDDQPMERLGFIQSVVGDLVVVQGTPGTAALDAGSVLVFDDRSVLGEVFETLGPVARPFYSVRFNSAEDIAAASATPGREVYFAPTYATHILAEQLKLLKGSDASNLFDEEPSSSVRSHLFA